MATGSVPLRAHRKLCVTTGVLSRFSTESTTSEPTKIQSVKKREVSDTVNPTCSCHSAVTGLILFTHI